MEAQYYDFELLPACRPWFASGNNKKESGMRMNDFSVANRFAY
jgi:hypothetical protein